MTARGVRFDHPMVLTRTSAAAGRVGIQDGISAEPVADFLLDVMGIDVPGQTLRQEGDWLAAYEAAPLATFQAAKSAQDGLYEQIHIIRRGSLCQLVGKDWLDEISARPSYGWLAGKDSGQAAPPANDRATRALAWLDYACVCRNKVRHHRKVGVRARFVVTPAAICEVYWTGTPQIATCVDLLRSPRNPLKHLSFGAPDSGESVAYLSAIAEAIHTSEPEVCDEQRHAVRSSGVYVLVGSAAFIDNLDDSLAVLIEERFSSASP